MRVQTFEALIRSEAAAFRVLRRKRYKTGRLICHACASRTVYRLSSGRIRCGRCRYTFGVFTGTWVGQTRIPLTIWLWLVTLFELEVTARQAMLQTGVSAPTALGIFTTIRRALVAHEDPELLRGEVEADESYFGGRRQGRRGRGARYSARLWHPGAAGAGLGHRGAECHGPDTPAGDGHDRQAWHVSVTPRCPHETGARCLIII